MTVWRDVKSERPAFAHDSCAGAFAFAAHPPANAVPIPVPSSFVAASPPSGSNERSPTRPRLFLRRGTSLYYAARPRRRAARQFEKAAFGRTAT